MSISLRLVRATLRGSDPVEPGFAALRGDQTGAYAGFIGDEGEERVREAYPGSTWDRLAAIKRRYDPTNLFRLNQNIPVREE